VGRARGESDTRTFSAFFPILGALLLSGCVTMGGRQGLPDHVRSIAIPTFTNRTLEYGAEETVTAVIVHEFQQDGRLRLEKRDRADAVLLGTITRYDLYPVGFDGEDRVSVSRVETDVEVDVLDRITLEPLLEDERFSASGVFSLTADPSERREKDVFIRLADDIISRLIEGW
jgi:hypothetical protein